MKRSYPANIDGQIFYIDDDAFTLLQNYLKELKNTFTGEEGQEIVSDIESRIRELFNEKILKGATVVTIDDVNAVISIMGRPEEISDSTAAEPNGESTAENGSGATESNVKTESESVQPECRRRLYRNMQNKIFGGVFGGLALYLGWNVTIMRLIYAVLTVVTYGIPGIVIYLIMWMIVPPALSPEQICEMNAPKPSGSSDAGSNSGFPVIGSTGIASRKLYRDMQNKVLGGVMGGLGVYLGWNSNIMRLLFVVVTCMVYVWPCLVIYLILWMIIPPAITPRQILQMYGEPVNVGTIGQTVIATAASTPPPHIENDNDANFLKVFFKSCFKILAGILGFMAGIADMALVIAFIVMIFASVAYYAYGNHLILDHLPWGMESSVLLCISTVFVWLLVGIVALSGIVWGVLQFLSNTRTTSRSSFLTLLIIETILVGTGISLSIILNQLY
ncbi:MAG: PspC domain-containing protein [Muribaculaceae bacterium]|nr:PspC domain-containing protein [Muribaculaceae bacterium]